ncbi:MAG: YchJ family protein [Pseudomonas sp.]|nr:YchJ family protein [Pseudomonas sp.]MDY0413421.1 YchJ family protein [Pseudomonas sp.]
MTETRPCPCNPNRALHDCCGRYHLGALASSAQALMRARYSAYATQHIEFIKSTSLPAQQAHLDMAAIAQWSQNSQWLGLEVIAETLAQDQRHATVEFIAHWQDEHGRQQHQETSLFIKPAERWFFYDPTAPLRAERNAPCPCASGLKFKKCCAPYF